MANSEFDSTGAATRSPRLTLPVKLAYGAGDAGSGLTANLLAFSFLYFLISVAGLTPSAASLVLLIGKIWDAVNDPIVGFLSDRTQTRWGRRYPWMFLSGIPFGIAFYLTWIVPGFESSTAKFWYYVIISIVFQIFYTTTNLPYTTMTAEMTQDYDERTELTSFRLAFSLAGAVSILALGLVVSQWIPDPARRFAVLGALGGVISIVCIYWCIFGTFKYTQQHAQAQKLTGDTLATPDMPFPRQLQIVFSNRPFLFVIGIYLFSWLALQMTAAVLPFYVQFWMGESNWFLAALLVQGVAIPMMFVCSWLSQRMGKKGLYFLGSGVWILVQIALFSLQPGQTTWMYVLCAIAGFGVAAAAYVVPWSILPDVIELDELNTGKRREGVFYAFMTLLQKLGLAVGIYLVGVGLEASGFIEESAGQAAAETVQQPESALLAIRFFMGPVPLVALLCGLVLAYFYPITRAVYAEIALKLSERRQSADPGG
ncbi:MFS transporter [Romeria aff. gracilis LEGE 07310]|uniref:MFS transporter n=1 Tax=Vasconcelosia minhoensis LEGE 07310 TaxID=915328 RepID=A0A8J7A693_9CYAN|nr:MFS transporter [Romeria gracilis]MBE9076660.1 MFS transporter [Romeria aff. gracilis LEGE 07310]